MSWLVNHVLNAADPTSAVNELTKPELCELVGAVQTELVAEAREFVLKNVVLPIRGIRAEAKNRANIARQQQVARQAEDGGFKQRQTFIALKLDDIIDELKKKIDGYKAKIVENPERNIEYYARDLWHDSYKLYLVNGLRNFAMSETQDGQPVLESEVIAILHREYEGTDNDGSPALTA